MTAGRGAASDLTISPLKTRLAQAQVRTQNICALAVVLTWCRQAFVNINITLFSTPTRLARTLVIAYKVDTICTVSAGYRQALVDFTGAEATVVSCGTFADKPVHSINARGTVCAWAAVAFVDVDLAVIARIANRAIADIRCLCCGTRSTILTWVRRCTSVRIRFAKLTVPAGSAVALKTVHFVHTQPAVGARK